jgi:alpha-L-rhamnosidase
MARWTTRVALLGLILPLAAESTSAADSRPSVDVVELRCEYLQDPLGIDVKQPRLSWRLAAKDASARGLRQTAYQVLVANDPERLAKDEGDLWDSAEVTSNQSVHVVYAGRPLTSGMRCFWKVRVRDQAGVWSAWSKPASWTMGLLDKQDWSAQWIGTDAVFVRKKGWPPPDNTMPDPWFRKMLVLESAPKHATLYVASIGYHEVYVNGRKVGDTVLAPCVTNHKKRARYCTYDIAEHLRPGKNVIGLWLGTSWSIFPPYKRADKPASPLVLAQAEIELAGGKHLRVVTDGTWRTHPSPNTLLGVWDFMHYGGELYDANQELPASGTGSFFGPPSHPLGADPKAEKCACPLGVEGWCEVQGDGRMFAAKNGTVPDDSAWKQATVFSPDLTLSAEMVEPNRTEKKIDPVAIEERPGGEYRVDLGTNFAGFVEIDLRGKPGRRIDMQFSELPNKAMTHQLHSAYVLGPSGKGTFRNRFNYTVGRWITIKGLDAKPALADIRAHLVRTDYRRAAEFECSDKLLNDIHRATLWTFENLSLGGYVVDCPHRERMGYGGDAHATTETALNSYHLGAFYTKWAQDWRDVQGQAATWGVDPKTALAGPGSDAEEGNLPYTAPTYWGGGGPAWCGYCVTLPWLMYRQYGDVRILEDGFPTIRRWLAFVETKSKGDMLVRWGGQWDFLGDWLWPGAKGVNGDTPETLFFNNCYWIYNLQTAARIADVLGRRDAADAYRRRADAVRHAVHAKFFRPEDNSYVNGFQAYLSIALLVDLPPENLRAAVARRLEDEILVRRRGHIHAGITGGYFVIKQLLESGRNDLILAMATKTDYPGWGDMLRRGATTLWESWEGDNSLLHSSYLYLGLWFIEGLGGIQPGVEHGGFQSFTIRPGVVPGRLDWVRARYESPYGPIASAWKVEGNTLHCSLQVPPNTTALFLAPTKDAGSVRESGRPAAESAGVRPVGIENGRAAFRLESGRYEFEMGL